MTPALMIDARASVLAMLPRRGIGVEVGVWKANYSFKILNIARPSVLHLVDPWKMTDLPERAASWYGSKSVTQADMDKIHDDVARKLADRIEKGQVVIHRDFSQKVLAGFEPDSVDYVYIDGDHSYEGCKADLLEAVRIVKPGGFVCADDYSVGQWWKDDIIRAVNEVAAERGLTFRFVYGSQVVMQKAAA